MEKRINKKATEECRFLLLIEKEINPEGN